jgi:multicomponent Na+:H+ antiporter subunit B
MNDVWRRRSFLLGALGIAALFVWGAAGLPPLGDYRGPYGDVINRVGVEDRSAVNLVNTVTFDYRGIDTVMEELILFAAAMGVSLLLRVQREESMGEPADHAPDRVLPDTSDAVRVWTLGAIAPAVLLGLYVVAHGHLTPGGGFQGGVVLATAPLLVYLSGRYLVFRTLNPVGLLDLGEGVGVGGFLLLGILGLLASTSFLDNFLGFGLPKELLSGGILPPANVTVALAVAAGILLIIFEFLEQTLVVGKR